MTNAYLSHSTKEYPHQFQCHWKRKEKKRKNLHLSSIYYQEPCTLFVIFSSIKYLEVYGRKSSSGGVSSIL